MRFCAEIKSGIRANCLDQGHDCSISRPRVEYVMTRIFLLAADYEAAAGVDGFNRQEQLTCEFRIYYFFCEPSFVQQDLAAQ